MPQIWKLKVQQAKRHQKLKKKKKIWSRSSPKCARYALSVQGSTSAKRGVKHEDAGFVTCAKREARAKHTIQQKHILSLQHALSARSERAKRTYEGPKLISASINRDPSQGKTHILPQSTSLSIPSHSKSELSLFSLHSLLVLSIFSFTPQL